MSARSIFLTRPRWISSKADRNLPICLELCRCLKNSPRASPSQIAVECALMVAF